MKHWISTNSFESADISDRENMVGTGIIPHLLEQEWPTNQWQQEWENTNMEEFKKVFQICILNRDPDPKISCHLNFLPYIKL